LLLSVFSTAAAAQTPDDPLWEKALQIHDEAIVMDAHAHANLFSVPEPSPLNLGKKTGESQIDFPTMKEGGLDAVFMALPLRGDADRNDPPKGIAKSAESVRSHLGQYSNLAELALSAADVRRIHATGKRAVLLSIESQGYTGGKTDTLDALYEKGIRSITLSHSRFDRIAESDTEDAGDNGLSKFGRSVIKTMNRLGMLIDITHIPDRLQREIIEESKAPVMASHSCVRALHDKPRNIPDDILKAIAEKGGLVAVTFFSGHLSKEFTEQASKADAKFETEKAKLEEKFGDDKAELDRRLRDLEAELAPPKVEIDLVIDHIDHAMKVAGVDHVGIGSDFGGDTLPIGLEDASGFPLITYHLLKRGYSGDDIKKILGGNLLRVLEESQKQAT
jgi:membrane dipeptidase